MSIITPKVIHVNGKPVGKVSNGVFQKTIAGSKHMLRTPKALAFDVSSLRDAADAGAERVEVYDSESRTTYTASLACLREHGAPLERGYGRQWFLALDWWNVNGERAKNEIKAAQTNREIKNLQGSLFEGAQ